MIRIFPKHPEADDTYYIGGAWAPAAITARDKRFSEAELAAVYWHDYSIYVREAANLLSCQERHMTAATESFKEAVQKCEILERFARLPHFDEEPA
jgi:hypothetical protein